MLQNVSACHCVVLCSYRLHSCVYFYGLPSVGKSTFINEHHCLAHPVEYHNKDAYHVAGLKKEWNNEELDVLA